MAFFDHETIHAGLADADKYRWLRYQYPTGMTVQIPSGESAGLAIWMEPDMAGRVVPYTLSYAAALPDPAAEQPANWASCVVPQPTELAWPFDAVPAPATLSSSPDSTWFYLYEKNVSPIDCPLHEVSIYLDGELFFPLTGPALAGGAERASVGWTGVPVRAGRHAVTLRVNPNATLVEEEIGNNHGGTQWSWTGTPVAWDVSSVESAPPASTGGWDEATVPPSFLNCAGYTTPDLEPEGNRAFATYIVPEDGSNHDLRLHPHTSSAEEGFKQYLANSNAGAGEADFIVMGPAPDTSPLHYDVGVVRMHGSGDFVLQCARSDTRTINGIDGNSGNHTLAAGDMLDVHKVSLGAGGWNVRVSPTGGEPVDLGVSMHPFGGLSSRTDAIALVNETGAASRETLPVVVEEASIFVLAVWRDSDDDVAEPVVYNISFSQVPTGVGGSVQPGSTAIHAAAPNPFVRETMIAFDLGEPGPVDLSVFDAQGRRVRRIRGGYLAVGRYTEHWDGRDASGRSVANGLYFVRLQTPAGNWSRKVVKLD
jgi:hypothetical protein